MVAGGAALVVTIGYVGLVVTHGPATTAGDVGRGLPPLAMLAPSREIEKASPLPSTVTPGAGLFGAGGAQDDTSPPPSPDASSAPVPPVREPMGLEIEAPLPPIRPSENPILTTPRRLGALLTSGYDKWTAVYDITARSVYLPDGTRLEAHSGLGDSLDDPRYVSVHDRGATPPHLYQLELRESLFHGVQALRLTPIGEGDLFGRVGLLAHPYMLGPRGDSNGCVSFKNYDAFLRAYQSGQVKRLAVVARLD